MEFCQGAEKLVRDIALPEKRGIPLLTQEADFSLSHPNLQDAYLAPPSVVTHVLGNTPFHRDGKLLQIY